MRIAYFDCFAGISGDMTVGALLSAGLPLEHLIAELEKLPLRGYEISARFIERSMISAVKFNVKVTQQMHHHHAEDHDHHHEHADGHLHQEHTHEHEGHHEHHGHAHHHHHDEDHSHEEHEVHVHHHHGMSYAQIRDIIEESALSQNVKRQAQAIFYTIGEAEARVHNIPLCEIHFHEVGAVDSIVDIVATAIGLDYFGVEECRSRVVPLGNGGTIVTAHGIMPIPPPATIEILKGYQTELGVVAAEMTTPTGAGIVRALSRGLLVPNEEIESIAIGYGAGTKEFQEVPNLLRIVIGELKHQQRQATAFPHKDQVIQLTTAIDDMPATQLAYVHERLMDEGALDVYLRPILMKKGRGGHELVVLAQEDHAERMLSVIEHETTTLGIRYERIQRRIAPRAGLEFVHSEWGLVHAKMVERDGFSRTDFEYEDVKRIARQSGLPYRDVQERLRRELLPAE